MDQHDAKLIAEKQLATIQRECPVAISFNDEITEKHPVGYVFFYNATKYWETKDFIDSLAGNGPILVKNDGEVVTLPSHQSVQRSLDELPSRPPA